MSLKSDYQFKQLARELALKLLFQKEFNSEIIPKESWPTLFEKSIPKETVEYTQILIHGVEENMMLIDEQIKLVAKNWKIERMSLVDRNLLRLGVFEMKFSSDPLPAAIVINEYVELAKRFGGNDSGSFVNGILDQVAKDISWQKK